MVIIKAWNKSDAVNAVGELLDIAYNDAPKQQLRILLENERMARLIGQAGKVIQPVRQAHPGAEIQFYPRYAPFSDERILKILAPSSETADIFRQLAVQMPFLPMDTKIRPYVPNTAKDKEFHNWGGYSPDVHEFRATSTPVREVTSQMPRKKHRPNKPPCPPTTSDLPVDPPTLTARQQLLPATTTSHQVAQETTSNPQTSAEIAELVAQTNTLRQLILQHRQMTTSMASPPASSARLEDAPLNPLWQPAANEQGTRKKVYVFGESHIRATNGCTLEKMLQEAQVQVVRYAAISGARYSRLEGMVITALKEAQDDTIVAVIAGSNDCRDLAQNLTPRHNITFNDSAMSIQGMDTSSNLDTLNTTSSSRMILKPLQNILKAATQSKAKVIIASPPPSPCYGMCSNKKDPKYNVWCTLSPCVHEQSYFKIAGRFKSVIQAHCKKANQHNIFLLDATSPFLLQSNRTSHDPIVDRRHFRKNNIHLDQVAALKLSKLCLEFILAHFH